MLIGRRHTTTIRAIYMYACVYDSAVPADATGLGGGEDSTVALLIRGRRRRQPETRYFQSLIRNENNIRHDERVRVPDIRENATLCHGAPMFHYYYFFFLI